MLLHVIIHCNTNYYNYLFLFYYEFGYFLAGRFDRQIQEWY